MAEARCPLCNSIVGEDDRVCRLCGEELHSGWAPPPRPENPVADHPPEVQWDRPPARGLWYQQGRFQALAAGVLLIVLVLSIGLFLNRDPSSAAPPASQSSAPVPIDPSEPEETTPEPEPEPAPDPEEVALEALNQLADEGLAATEFDNRWVAQLTSKAVGVKDAYQVTSSGSHTFAAVDILEQIEGMLGRSDLGEVFVLRSTDYGRQQTSGGKPMWVVFADAGFESREQVWDWCQETFPFSGKELENACAIRRLRG